MKTQTFTLVQDSFAKVAPIADAAAALFYDNLCKRDPGLRALFRSDLGTQGARLMQMIAFAVNRRGNPDALLPELAKLGRDHVRYGVRDSHCATVGAALIDTLEAGLGDAFTPQVRDAWLEVYGLISTTMRCAANEVALAA